jgi:hypothetical protein
MHLAEIGQAGLLAGEIPMSDEGAARMGISFDAIARNQHDVILQRLAETVRPVGGHRHNLSLDREILHGRPQAARANDRLFWRR